MLHDAAKPPSKLAENRRFERVLLHCKSMNGRDGTRRPQSTRFAAQLSRSRKLSQPNFFTHSSASVSLSHSQIEGSGTPLNVVVLTIE